MLNPAHILEIALLLLAAFLSGAAVGALARLAVSHLMPKRTPTVVADAVVADPAKPEETPALVAAPVIGEVVRTPTPVAPAEVPALDFTEALLALAGDKPGGPPSTIRMPSLAPLPAVAVPKPTEEMRPARVAGETTAGRVVAHPRSSAAPVRVIPQEGLSAEVIPFPVEKPAFDSAEPSVVVVAPMASDDPAAPIVSELRTPKPEPEPESATEPAAEAEAAPAETEVLTAPVLVTEVRADATTAVEVETTAAPELAAFSVEPDVAVADAPQDEPNASAAEIAQPDATPAQQQLAAVAPEPVVAAELEPSADDDEAAAMRAIEGNWSPRRTASPSARRPALPEVSTEAAIVASAVAVAAAAEAVTLATAAEPDEAPGRPTGIPAPRLGVKDDLTHIIGILPIIETALNSLGLYHFDQVAELTDENAGWIENHLGIAGRIGREHWREQARGLAPSTAGTKKAAGQ